MAEGELQVDDGTGTLTFFDVSAEVLIFGLEAFEDHIPGFDCSLSLDIGDVSGPVGGEELVVLSASDVSVAEAPESCGAGFGNLLNAGFGLPSTNAEVQLDLHIIRP